MAAAAERAFGRAVEGASGAGTDLDVAGKTQGTVRVRRDLEPSTASLEWFRLLGRRLARGGEAALLVVAVAKGLVLGIAATAKSGPRSRFLPLDVEIGVNR
jgi:hypothetical protein